MTTEKIQDYKGGEIHRTPSGNYIFIEGEKHAGEYATVADLKLALDRRDVKTAAPNDVGKKAKPSRKKTSTSAAKAKQETES